MTDTCAGKAAFNTRYFRDYYKGYRNKFSDLFESEKYFIRDFASGGSEFLDIGCAEGGMYEILSGLAGAVNYTGIDAAPNMVKQAKKNYPQAEFFAHAKPELPFKDNAFSRVLSLGVAVHEPQFSRLLSEAWRVAREMLFFDIRLIPGKKTLNNLCDGYVLDGSSIKYPYVVVNAADFFTLLEGLKPKPVLTRAFGYWGKANEYALLPEGYEKICMAAFLLCKDSAGRAAQKMRYELNLPFSANTPKTKEEKKKK